MSRYCLVDFAAHYQKGFRNHVVAISDVPELLERFNCFGCYSSYFFFSDELLTYMSAQTAALPSVAGYPGKVWAPYLPLDLDHPDVLPALECARLLSDLLLELALPGAILNFRCGLCLQHSLALRLKREDFSALLDNFRAQRRVPRLGWRD